MVNHRTSAWRIWIAGCTALTAGSGACVLDAAPVPIAVTGWNNDTIIEENSPNFANTFASAGQGNYAFAQTGDTDSNGATVTTGLPAETLGSSVNFTAADTNSVTGGNTVFQLQPYGTATGSQSDNILGLSQTATNTGTLTLANASAYSNLAVLATADEGDNYGKNLTTQTTTGSLTINFQGGGTLVEPYYSTNWTTSTIAPIAYTMGDVATMTTTGANPTWTVDAATVYLFETDINLNGQSVLVGGVPTNAATVPITSITFTGSTRTNAYTGIFGLSGTQAVPEPTASITLLGVAVTGLLSRRRRIKDLRL